MTDIFGDRTQSIAEHDEKFAFPEVIADGSREYLHYCRGCFRDAFDGTKRDHGRAQHTRHEYR